jgi:hypothetical protein
MLHQKNVQSGIRVEGTKLHMPHDMSGVLTIEVFGCADAATLEKQQQEKKRQERMAQKNQQVAKKSFNIDLRTLFRFLCRANGTKTSTERF